jgi:hypothetical protein
MTICHDYEKHDFCTSNIRQMLYEEAKAKRLNLPGYPDVAKAIQDLKANITEIERLGRSQLPRTNFQIAKIEAC